jgi:hypothetical protein
LERTYPLADSERRGPQLVKIPQGTYHCERTRYHRGGYDTFEIAGVPGHSRLLFHAGNVEADSEGCVLLGQRFGFSRGSPGVLQSRMAFAEFMSVMGFRPNFRLEVRNA